MHIRSVCLKQIYIQIGATLNVSLLVWFVYMSFGCKKWENLNMMWSNRSAHSNHTNIKVKQSQCNHHPIDGE